MAIQSVDQGLYTRLIDVSNIGCRLSWFLAHHDGVRVDKAEGIDHYLALDGLNGIDHDGDGARIQLLERLKGKSERGRPICSKRTC